MGSDNGAYGGAEDQVIETAKLVDLALGQAAAMASKINLPTSDVWPIAEFILDRATHAAESEEMDRRIDAARDMMSHANADPVLARFVAGEPL